jgi:hypothetical protein
MVDNLPEDNAQTFTDVTDTVWHRILSPLENSFLDPVSAACVLLFRHWLTSGGDSPGAMYAGIKHRTSL